MLRIVRSCLSLVLLASVLALLPAARAEAQEATPAATPLVRPQQPPQPESGPGSSEALFGGMTSIEQTVPGLSLTDYWLFVPTDPVPGTPRVEEPFPLVIFLHGSGAFDADPYLAWIEHLVRRGAVVLYPLYQNGGARETEYRQALQEDVRSGLETLEDEGVAVDPTRVAVVGHSLGGPLAVDYAASAAAAGLPVPTAVMGVVPGCNSEEVTCLGADPSAIPATTRVLLVTNSEDVDPTVPPAIERIWAGLEGVPLENRDVVRLVTDAHGRPILYAAHTQALTDDSYNPLDAYDWYGTWKWLDALMSCAFDGEWCEYALGNTPEQRYMGEWSDGVPVTEAVVTDDPV